jgi:cholesterol oxidase
MDWADYASEPVLRFAAERLRAWSRLTGGVLVPDLGTLPVPGVRSFGVHPLGGARMGRDAGTGVVDDRGRVFAPGGDGRGVYEGLFIADGSIVPGAVGVPPSLTIAALGEHVAAGILAAAGSS